MDDVYWIVTDRDMPLLKDYALTHLQFDQFQQWATGKFVKGSKMRRAPLFEVIFQGELKRFLEADHGMEGLSRQVSSLPAPLCAGISRHGQHEPHARRLFPARYRSGLGGRAG